jgi:hypothetical protein
MTTYDEDGNPVEDESGELPADEGDEPEDELEEGDQETPVVVAKTTPAPPPQKLVRKPRAGSGKKKPPVAGKPDARRGPPVQLSEVGLAALNKKRGEAGHLPSGVGQAAPQVQGVRSGRSSIDPSQEPTKELVIRWPLVLEKLADEGLEPSAVALGVYCISQGPYASAPAHVGTVDGRSVAGGGELSPGESIRDYIEVNFHSVMQKPARYEARIYYKTAPSWQPRGGNMICNGWLELPAYDTLVQLRSRQAAWVSRHPSSGSGVGALMPTIPPPAAGPPPLSPHVLQTLQAMGYQIIPVGGAPVPQPLPAPGPSFSEDITRELLGRMLRGEPIGAQPPAPVVIPAPAPAPYEPPHVPSITEQLETVAQLIKLVDQIRPPAPTPVAAVGVGRAREAAVVAAEPASPFAGLREAFKMVREATNLQEELAGLTGNRGGGDDEDDERPAANPVEKPFEILEVAGVGKWPYGDKLSTFEQIKTFAMLNPDITMGAVSKASELIDKSALGAFFRFLIERGTAAQRAAAQGAIERGMGRGSPGSSPPPAMPPVIRPPAFARPQAVPAQANGAAPATVEETLPAAPAPAGWTPMT